MCEAKRVITFGTFDLFHVGHLNIIERAAVLGDWLCVGVSSDELNYTKKGFWPVFPFEDRCKIVNALKCVNEVFMEASMERKREYVERFHADLLVMGHDWEGRFDHLRDQCEVVYLPRTKDISTTKLMERLKYPM